MLSSPPPPPPTISGTAWGGTGGIVVTGGWSAVGGGAEEVGPWRNVLSKGIGVIKGCGLLGGSTVVVVVGEPKSTVSSSVSGVGIGPCGSGG